MHHWLHATDGDFQNLLNPDGTCNVSGANIPLMDGGSVTVSGHISSGGSPLSVDDAFDNSNGVAEGTETLSTQIIIAQPGVSSKAITPEQSTVLAAAASYLKETVGIDISIICSD